MGLSAWYADIPTGTFNPSVIRNDTSAAITFGGSVTIPGGELAFHPGELGQYSIVRWIAPSDGKYDLATTFTGLDFIGPTSTDVHVLYNGSQLFNDSVNGFGISSAKNYTDSLCLFKGDIIDFAVGVGSNGNYFFDTTGIDVTIVESTPCPEPSTIFGLGALGFGAFFKRKLAKAKESNKTDG